MTVVTVAEEIVEEGEYDESNLSAENPPVALRAANSSSGDLPQKAGSEVVSQSPEGTLSTPNASPAPSTLSVKLYNTGLRIFYAMEFVGEIVCNMMGLTESKYQYVIDSMDANDWKVAREIEKRKNDDAVIQESA